MQCEYVTCPNEGKWYVETKAGYVSREATVCTPHLSSMIRMQVSDMPEWLNPGTTVTEIRYHPTYINGDRVQLLPHTDLFMRGEAYATVERIGTKYLTIRGERTLSLFRVDPTHVRKVS